MTPTPHNDGSGAECVEHSYHVVDGAAEKSRISSLSGILRTQYGVTDEALLTALSALGEATAHIAVLLTNYVEHTYVGTQNASGDDQLHLDIDCDNAVFAAIRASGVFSVAASEETPVETVVGDDNNNTGFLLGFDPLDGSSIIDANFSVGSIFGIWPATSEPKGILGRTGREQVAAAVSVYGPRTTFCIAIPSHSSVAGKDATTLEVTLVKNRTEWEVSRPKMTLAAKGKVFAPGNLRAANDNEAYGRLIQYWLKERYTLRYSGGMVPDVYHSLIKGKGVFSNASSEQAKAKLRLLYEVAPVGLLIECAGGTTTHEARDQSVLDIPIDDLDQRCGVCFGSSDEVAIYKQFMFPSNQPN
eukprot:scaffold85475_cov44-Attheya_sp.AAC.1